MPSSINYFQDLPNFYNLEQNERQLLRGKLNHLRCSLLTISSTRISTLSISLCSSLDMIASSLRCNHIIRFQYSGVVSNFVKWGNSPFWPITDTQILLLMRMFETHFSRHVLHLTHYFSFGKWSFHLVSLFLGEEGVNESTK